MFGDKMIAGLEKVSISHNSIYLPNFTNAEEKENLIFYFHGNNLALYPPTVIFKKLDIFFEKQKNVLTYKQLLALRRIIYGKLLSEERVKNGKIIIPPKARNFIKGKAYIKGYYDNIRIFNNLDDIKKYELTLK